MTAVVLGEHLDVNLRKWFSSLVVDSKLAVLLIDLNLEVRLVESLEDLGVLGIDLDNKILLLEIIWQLNSLNFLGHLLFKSLFRFDIAELLGLVLNEGLSGEEDFRVDFIIFDGELLNIALFDNQVSLAVDGDLMDHLSVVLGFDVGALDIHGLVLIIHVKVTSIDLFDFRKLLIHLFEHLSQMLNWIVSILSDDPLNFIKVWFRLVEFEIGSHVVEEHFLVIFEILSFDFGEDLVGGIDSVLKLQIVG